MLISLGVSSKPEASAKNYALALLAAGRKRRAQKEVFCRKFTEQPKGSERAGATVWDLRVELRLHAPQIFILNLAQFCLVLCFFYLFIRAPFF